MLAKWIQLKSTTQIIIAMTLGIIFGIAGRNINILHNFIDDAEEFKKLGLLSIKLMNMIAMPLIFTSIVSSILSVNCIYKVQKMAKKTIIIFLFTTLLAALIGILCMNIFKIGKDINADQITSSKNLNNFLLNNTENIQINTISDFLHGIIPGNIFNALSTNNYLQVIFFAAIMGIALLLNDHMVHESVIAKGIQKVRDIMMDMMSIVMNFVPIGTFGIMTWLFATQDYKLVQSCGKLVLLMFVACFLHTYVVYGFLLLINKINPIYFFRKIIPVQLFGFLTASSGATMPYSLKIAKDKLGVSQEKADFVIPLGTTINMNGTAIYFTVCAMYGANLYGIDLSLYQYGILIIMSIFCAAGTAPVSGASLIMFCGILYALHIPIEVVGILLGVEKIFDMARTSVNVTGDLLTAVLIDKSLNTLDIEKYES